MIARAAAVALALAAAPASAAEIAHVPLAPHRAVYDLTLVPSRLMPDKTLLASATGRIVSEFTGSACDGWINNLSIAVTLRAREGGTSSYEMRLSSFESAEADRYRFISRTLLGERVLDETNGTARRGPDGAVHVELTHPASRSTDLPPGILFHTQYVLAMLDAARTGRTHVEGELFDEGGAGDTAFATTVEIGEAITEAVTEGPTAIEAFRGLRRWPMTVTYLLQFGDGRPPVPVYQASGEVYENGVARTLVQNYGWSALRGDLVSLDMLPASPCPER